MNVFELLTRAAVRLRAGNDGPQPRARFEGRLRGLALHLGLSLGEGSPRELNEAVAAWWADAAPEKIWKAHTGLRARMPLAEEVIDSRRRIRLDGPASALTHLSKLPAGEADVRYLDRCVLVDLFHTARTDLATGIQRVARLTARRWDRDHDVTLVGWDRNERALRLLTEPERRRALGEQEGSEAPDDHVEEVVVPCGGTYVLPELAVEDARTARIGAMARFLPDLCTSVIGFDCVPITSAETAALGMSGAFAKNLAAVRHVDRVATISVAAGQEYQGWAEMLSGAGLVGPEIRPVVLPDETPTPTKDNFNEARRRLRLAELPMVLCVGSHEPRKNQVALLEAAEMCWRKGIRFNLVIVGGNAWRSEEFLGRVDELRACGRYLETFRGLSDGELFAAYRLAHCVVFPSLNEGFGLPVAESLASGTPAITSNFGSMAEIVGDGGGALLVNPHDDDDLAHALEQMLTDKELYKRLRAEAAARPVRTWDSYAAEVWDFLVEGR